MSTFLKLRPTATALAVGTLSLLALPSAASAFISLDPNHVVTAGASPSQLTLRCDEVTSVGSSTTTSATFLSSYDKCKLTGGGLNLNTIVYASGGWSLTAPGTVLQTSVLKVNLPSFGGALCLTLGAQGPFTGVTQVGSLWSLALTGLSWSAPSGSYCATVLGATSGTNGTYTGNFTT